MKIHEKIDYLQDNHMGEWLRVRRIVDEELSNQNGMFCVCGKLATGLHESGCRKFIHKVNSETVKRLKYLLSKTNDTKEPEVKE